MKTATVRQLRNQYREVIGWVEAGEVVKISRRGKIIARLVPEKSRQKRVDWTKSAAFTMDRSKMTFLSAKQVQKLIHDASGKW